MDQFGFFLVLTGIVGLPWDFLASTFITLGSGTPYTIDDQSRGGGVNERQLMRNANRPEQFTFIIPDAWAYRSVDLQVEKTFRFLGPNQIAFIFQGFNIFSFVNFSWYQGFIPTLPAVNQLRPAEQPPRSGATAAVRGEVWIPSDGVHGENLNTEERSERRRTERTSYLGLTLLPYAGRVAGRRPASRIESPRRLQAPLKSVRCLQSPETLDTARATRGATGSVG